MCDTNLKAYKNLTDCVRKLKDQMAEKNAEIKELNGKITNLETNVEEKNAEITAQKTKIKNLETNVKEIRQLLIDNGILLQPPNEVEKDVLPAAFPSLDPSFSAGSPSNYLEMVPAENASISSSRESKMVPRCRKCFKKAEGEILCKSCENEQ